MITSSPYMELALEQAQLAAGRDEVPVGAVIVLREEKQVLAAAGNRTRELNDPTAHAEMLAIREACAVLKTERLSGCDMYVTLEPCPMCAQAISFARLERLYYAASDPKGGGVEHGAKVFSAASCHHRLEVYSGLYEIQAATLLKEFFGRKR